MLLKLNKIFSKKKNVLDPPYEYKVLASLENKEYPFYLEKLFKFITGDNLNLKHPKTFNEKIQWLKLYDATPLKTQLTDKVLVRDWVKEKIGDEYLKPVLQICKNFDEIDFESLPNEFIIKANHGCKWHYIIKNKEKFLATPQLVSLVKTKFAGWLEQNFCFWAGFEMQYKDIKPQIIIEKLLTSSLNPIPIEYEIYCFNGVPKIYQKVKYSLPATVSVYNENFEESDICFNSGYIKNFEPASENLKKAVELSKILAKDFKFVRVDWLLVENKFYFNEMTFSPHSGFFDFVKKEWNQKLGELLQL